MRIQQAVNDLFPCFSCEIPLSGLLKTLSCVPLEKQLHVTSVAGIMWITIDIKTSAALINAGYPPSLLNSIRSAGCM